MNDQIDQYKERVRKRLCRREDDPVMREAEALFFPSFHPEALLRATSGPAGTKLRMTTLTSSMWYAEEGATGEQPKRIQEVASVSAETALRFWQSIEELNPEAIRTDDAIGADGVSIETSYRHGATFTSFEAWCPDPASSPGKFVLLIYDLAWKVLKEPASIERLENLHGYLRLGLPARVISGDLTCLRLFGGLSSYHQQELRRLFDSLPKDAPLVVDMTNFDGMGTLLYPAFIEFASARRLLAWAGSRGAKRHLDSMRLASSQVFDNTEEAIEWVKREQGVRRAETGGGVG